MSVHESGAAMYAAIRPAYKLILFFMGEACGDKGDCHVSIDFLELHTGFERQRIVELLAKMEAEGLVTYRGHSKRTPGREAFWINLDALDARRVQWDSAVAA